MLFDTHAHYDDEAFDADRDALLTALPDCGVGLVIDPGCDLTSSRRAVELAAAYPHVYAAVGIHPENCGGCTDDDLAALRPLAQQPKVVAIGEIGLDYYWEENPPREFQQQVFRRQLALARELQLPVIVHDREAHADTLSIVREFPDVTGVFHCFSGSPEMAQELLKLGWYLGFDGPVTYKNARRAPEVAAVTPLDRMLIETDSPYMTPVPYRGKRCDSGMIAATAARIAEIRGMSAETLLGRGEGRRAGGDGSPHHGERQAPVPHFLTTGQKRTRTPCVQVLFIVVSDAQHSLAPAGTLSSMSIRCSFSSPCSRWTAEISMPQLGMPIILRGGRFRMAMAVLPMSCSGS